MPFALDNATSRHVYRAKHHHPLDCAAVGIDQA